MSDRSSTPQALVVDDHDIVRLGVRHLLAGRMQVSEAATLREARDQLAHQSFDLLVLDLGLGDDFGLAALPQLRQNAPAMKIIVLTSMDEAVYAERALRAGADGYVMKSALTQSLSAAVDAVLAGEVYVSPRLGSALMRRVAGHGTAPAQPELSTRELEVLRLVAAGRSTREIADALNRSVKTIETHKQALKSKLGADNPAMLVRLAVAWCGDAH
jgi:DNA-binding NarL/FixJ family response regulator